MNTDAFTSSTTSSSATVPARSPSTTDPLSADVASAGRRPAIALEGLSKTYGHRKAVDGLTFSVQEGRVCGFIGPNGAGKTTTLRMLLGLIAPTSGSATVMGHPISRPADYLRQVGAMIEGPAFYPTLSARANLAVLAALGDIPTERIEHVLDLVGLTDRGEDMFRSYSLGMKQRLGIAAALLPSPKLLLLDEPTNGLDPPGIREIRELLRALADAGTTVLVSSHLLDELQQLCDDVVIIRDGSLLFAGSMGELVATQRTTLTVRPEHPDDLARLAALAGAQGHRAAVAGERLQISAPPSSAAELNRSAMDAGITLVEIGEAARSLEEIFFELTGFASGEPGDGGQNPAERNPS